MAKAKKKITPPKKMGKQGKKLEAFLEQEDAAARAKMKKKKKGKS